MRIAERELAISPNFFQEGLADAEGRLHYHAGSSRPDIRQRVSHRDAKVPRREATLF
jgi:hypothetical protein